MYGTPSMFSCSQTVRGEDIKIGGGERFQLLVQYEFEAMIFTAIFYLSIYIFQFFILVFDFRFSDFHFLIF